MIVPFAGAISFVRASCVRDRSTVASAARNWARAAAMSSGRGPFTASVSAACIWSSLARPASSAMRASSRSCLVVALVAARPFCRSNVASALRAKPARRRGWRAPDRCLPAVFRPAARRAAPWRHRAAPRRDRRRFGRWPGRVRRWLTLLHPIAFVFRHGEHSAFGVERQVDLADLHVAIQRAGRRRRDQPLQGQPDHTADDGDGNNGKGDTSHMAGSSDGGGEQSSAVASRRVDPGQLAGGGGACQ